MAEICNLIHANLSKDWHLQCEVQYSELLKDEDYPAELSPLARADLLVSKKPDVDGYDEARIYVIEVKRASAPKAQINADLYRLTIAKRAHKNLRAFMFIVAERQMPKRFVNPETGRSTGGYTDIKDGIGSYRVIGTWKASPAFAAKDKAQYACLLEIFNA